MAKKDPIKPIFPLKHEFVASLDRFVQEAGMLADTVEQLLKLGKLEGPTKSKGSPSFNHAWFIWDWQHKGAPTLAYGP